MKRFILVILLMASPALAQDGPVHVIDTGDGTAMLNWVDSQGTPHLQPVIIDRTGPDTQLITPLGTPTPDPLINQPALGGTDSLLLTE